MKSILFTVVLVFTCALSTTVIADEQPEPAADAKAMSFNNTRIAYAMLTGDDEALKQMEMRTEPRVIERVVAGLFILPMAALEAVTSPAFYALRYYEDATHAPSHPDYLPETPGLPNDAKGSKNTAWVE